MYSSWGNYPRVSQDARTLGWRSEKLPESDKLVLPRGLGRSYGDSCLNADNVLLLTGSLDRFIAFEPSSGLIACEAGVPLADILRLVVPQGWFLPVTPGTKFITVGGAVANDVHGKNHHRDGTFGHAVTRFELLRSDGARLQCSPSENTALFAATIGGLGLTGLITWVEFRLKRIANPFIASESIKFANLDEFFSLSQESEKDFAYTVSWIDCLASGASLGRGQYIRGNHAPVQLGALPKGEPSAKSVPFNFPGFALNGWSVKAFNELYYHRQQRKLVTQTTHYDPFFYPLDAIHHWNRIYGRRGFFQYQCVVPEAAPIREILGEISRAGIGSFLVVLKTFGDIPSLGMLSFPRPGVTLALDFPNDGARVRRLMDRLDAITRAASGAVYPAKDARMSGDSFRQFFPQWEAFSAHIDPRFSSSFWRRVMESQDA